jgi:hypothetical protein
MRIPNWKTFALTAFAVIGQANAHEPLPSAQWCANGRVEWVGDFAFGGAAIQGYATCLRSGVCPDPVAWPVGLRSGGGSPPPVGGGTCNPQNCGQFDDDYGVAARMAHSACSVYNLPPLSGPNIDFGTTTPVIHFPVTFNSADHHALYVANQGLSGACARCVNVVIVPSQ